MTYSELEQLAARQILETIPLVMRTLANAIRKSKNPVAPAHLRLLFMLSKKRLNLSQLAELQFVSLPTMSNIVSNGVERGWVRRSPDPADRRRVLLELTKRGEAVLADIQTQAETQVASVIDQVTVDRQKVLVKGLSVLRTAFAPEESELTSKDGR